MGKMLLFDIDQTLLFTGGAGSRAMSIAFEEIWGVSEAFAGFAFAGRADPAILREAFGKHAVAAATDTEFRAAIDRFQAIYGGHLGTTLKTIAGGRVLPGVVALLDALRLRDDVFLGVATGNFRAGAILKLTHFGLHDYFIDGGYGDDAEDRGEMVAAAARRLALHERVPVGAHEVIVIGDTEHNVNAGKVNGYRTIGVATGHTSREALLSHGADHAFDDLSDLGAVLAALGVLV